MEFPDAGVRCSIEICKQLDFLPFTCTHCRAVFCKEHFHVSSHDCPKFVSNSTVSAEGGASNYRCSQSTCEQISPVQMQCSKCNLHFCLLHRYHGCFELNDQRKLETLEKWQRPKEEFERAKAIVDKQVTNCLRKAKNVSTANKVQLMRLKGCAVGPGDVPMEERRYFLVHLPVAGAVKTAREPKAAFTCIRWTLGKTIDSLARTLGVLNTNNLTNTRKLRLFHRATGLLVSEQMDTPLTELFNDVTLTNGQRVILEYSDSSALDLSVYN